MKAPRLTNPIHLLALGFGTGLIRRAPGTWGSLLALPIWWQLQSLPALGYWLVVIAAAVAGIWLCATTARDIGISDPAIIVWDEIVGMLIALALTPAEPFWVLTGFLFFRIFDIFKPWPISWCDRHIKGGLGIMADDLAAGFAALAAQSALLAAVL